MLRTPKDALLAALVAALGLALTGIVALLSGAAHVRDAAALHGFTLLDRPGVSRLLDHIAHLADPRPYAVAGVVLVLVALARRRPWTAAAIPVILIGSELTTQILKGMLAQPRIADWLDRWSQIADASWPSGHATAAMAVALCAVLAAPPRLRPAVGALGGVFAVAVGYSILALAWHFPSDVIGGYLMAATWSLLAVGGLMRVGRRSPRPERAPGPLARRAPVAVAALVVLVGVAAVASRPGWVADYLAAAPTAFIAGALTIGALGAALALGLARGLGPRA